jgi:endo-1,4-beta-xylanase
MPSIHSYGDFRERGVPIDGVGFQMHVANLHAHVESISDNIKRFIALEVQVHIAEMDVALPVNAAGNPTREDPQRQAGVYRQIAAAYLSHRGCTAIQTCGFTDKYFWIVSHSKHKQGAALLFDRDYRPKTRLRGVAGRATVGKRSLVVGSQSFIIDR